MTKQWHIYDEDNKEILENTSFISYNFIAQSKIAQMPLEEGTFAHYNKVIEASTLSLKLAFAGFDNDSTQLLKKLEEEKTKASKLTILSPEKIFNNYSLQSVKYKKEAQSGIMELDLDFQEIKEINTTLSTSFLSPAKLINVCDASNFLRGHIQAISANSAIKSKISSYF